MNIDVTALKAVEREKGIPADTVIEAIESALVTAYRHADGRRQARPRPRRPQERRGRRARAGDSARTARSSASGTTPRPTSAGSPPAPPSRSSSSGCATPSTSRPSASTPARRATSSAASCRRTTAATCRAPCSSTSARSRRCCRRPSRCPTRSTRTAAGSRPTWCRSPALPRAAGHRLAHPPEPRPQALRARGAGDRRRQRRDRRGGPGGRAPLEDRRPHEGAGAQRQGLLHRADGPAGAQRDERAARREDRHRRLVRRPRDLRRPGAEPRPGHAAPTVVDPQAKAVRVVVPDYQLSLAIGKEGQNARLAARLTGCRIDIRSDAQADDDAATPSPGVGRRAAAIRPPGRLRGRPAAGPPAPSPTRGTSGTRHALECRVAETSIPVRTCVGCRKRAPVSDLLRVVVRSGDSGPGSSAAAPRKGGVGAPLPGVPARSGATPGLRPGAAPPRRRRPAGGRSAPGPRPRRLLGGARRAGPAGE